MQLGKSLVGALVGGAVGVAALIGIYMLTGWDKAWLAIFVALFTGLGVRWAADTKGHASYARGALTALIAILAFLAWYPIQAKITVGAASVAKPIVADHAEGEAMEQRAAAQGRAAPADTQEAVESGSDEADEPVEPPVEPATTPAATATEETAEPAEGEASPALAAPPRPRNQQFSTWDFVWLCIAGLIAYELGRGTAAATPVTGAMGSPDDGPPPVTAGQSVAPPA